MRVVSRFEANLLGLLQWFLQRTPPEAALPLLLHRCPPPPCLSRAAVELVRDHLAKGCVALLVHNGAWRHERYLRDGRAVEGRLWQRTRPEDLGLTFSRHALEFLLWVTANDPKRPDSGWQPPPAELTTGDRVLFYFAYEALRETDAAPALRALGPFSGHGLCWLAFPEDFAGATVAVGPELSPWTTGLGGCVLESLQPRLAERWTHLERAKAQVGDWRRMQALGQAQERVLGLLLDAADAAGRRDLVRFLLEAASRLLRDNPPLQTWVGGLDVGGVRLADRTATYRAALTVLRQLDRLQQWERQARAVGYFDEGYAAGQWWKAEWERWDGEILVARAQALTRQLEPLRA